MEQAITDKAPKPAGLVPKNLQAFLLVGLALLMVLIMAVTGHKRPVSPVAQTTSPLPSILPLNTDKVTDFQKSIEQTQLESAPQAEEALLQKQKQLAAQGMGSAQPFPPNPYGSPVTSANPNGAYPPGAYAAAIPQPAEEQPLADPIKDEQKKRAYLSLFSDNVALTYRKELRGQDPARNSSAPITTAGPADLAVNQDQLLAQAGAEIARQGQMLEQARKAGLIPPTGAGGNLPAIASSKNASDSDPRESPRRRDRKTRRPRSRRCDTSPIY